jgi:hypothetical protein
MLVFEELDHELSDYLWFDYSDDFGGKFIRSLWVWYNVFCRTDH